MGTSRLGAAGRHPRITAAAVAAAVALAVLAVAAARSRTGGCDLAPPVPDLPAQLRVMGDFDQPYDAAQTRELADAALRAATALHSALGPSLVGDPVEEAAAAPGGYAAIVFPLGIDVGPSGAPRSVVGLVSFLRGCAGQAWYHDVVDLAADPPAAFPRVSRDQAARLLDTASPELVYATSPFSPEWRDPATGRTVPAT